MQREEFLKQYGDDEVTFLSYYRYNFLFSNEKLTVGIGGNAESIYNREITSKSKIKALDPEWASIDIDGKYVECYFKV